MYIYIYVYICIYRWCQNYRTEPGVQKYGKIPYLRTPPDPDSARIRIRYIIKFPRPRSIISWHLHDIYCIFVHIQYIITHIP